MQTLRVEGVVVKGVYSRLPVKREDNLERCLSLYGDETKAVSVVKATGVRMRRVAVAGTTSLDLCVAAASDLMRDAGVAAERIGGVVFVTFTPAASMPCNACQAQSRLGLPNDVVAFDVGLACSGYAYGLYLAGTLAKATGKEVLLLDGDVQTPAVRADDGATVPVLADAGTATLVAPMGAGDVWKFAFMSKGEGGAALSLPVGGTIAMDGFAVYRFVATDVARFIREFVSEIGVSPETIDAFAPHQANVYMIRQLAKTLGFPLEKLLISGDEVGNSASATVPVTLSRCASGGKRVLLAGFGGGLSASAALVSLPADVLLKSVDY